MDLFDDDGERGVVESAGDEFFLVEAVPVDGSETDRVIFGVEDLVGAGVERGNDWRLGK
jgi:hypothetical protein